MTTRRWMVAVAIVGLSLAFLIAMDRRVAYLARTAEYHEKQAALAGRGHEEFSRGGLIRAFPPAAHETRVMEFHRRLAEKYRKAAIHPWLPVAPDLPEPD